MIGKRLWRIQNDVEHERPINSTCRLLFHLFFLILRLMYASFESGVSLFHRPALFRWTHEYFNAFQLHENKRANELCVYFSFFPTIVILPVRCRLQQSRNRFRGVWKVMECIQRSKLEDSSRTNCVRRCLESTAHSALRCPKQTQPCIVLIKMNISFHKPFINDIQLVCSICWNDKMCCFQFA